MKRMYSISEILVIICVIIMFFSGFLKTLVSPLFGYVDEFIVIILIFSYVLNLLLKKEKKISVYSFILICNSIIILIIGAIGNEVSNYQSSKFAIIVDMLSWQKFFLMFAILYDVLKYENISKYFHIINKLSHFFIICGFMIYILILCGKITSYYRYGIKTFYLGGHPSFACAFYALIIAFLMHDYKKNKIWIVLSAILSILTLRSKAFGYCLLIVLLILFLRKKISFNKILVIITSIIVLVWERISFYFLNSTASRAVALSTSIKILKNFFPIGSGFATYGTVMSGSFYSQAYYIYGLSNRWGFTLENNSFIGDGGLATIIGQFGVFGCVIFIFNIIVILNMAIKIIKKYKENILDIIALLGYVGISCTNETFFNSDVAVIYAIVLAILMKKYIRKGNEK